MPPGDCPDCAGHGYTVEENPETGQQEEWVCETCEGTGET
jgi:DnaJ-class molecular chaperone